MTTRTEVERGALTADRVHYGERCDCADAVRRIDRREADRRTVARGEDRRGDVMAMDELAARLSDDDLMDLAGL